MIVQLSDPHIGATWVEDDPVAALEAAVDTARRVCPSPEAVLVSGDLGDNAADAEYQQVRELVATHPETRGRRFFPLAYRTGVYWCDRI